MPKTPPADDLGALSGTPPETPDGKRAVLADPRPEGENPEASGSDPPGAEDEDSEGRPSEVAKWPEELDAATGATRASSRQRVPRPMPDPLFVELGDTLGTDQIRSASRRAASETASTTRDQAKQPAESPSQKPKKPRPKKKSRRERRKLARLKKKALAAIRRETSRKDAAEGELTAPVSTASQGQELTGQDALTMDDLEMENPLSEAAHTPGRDHSALLMDRHQRRLDAVARAEQKVRGQEEVWDQEDDASLEEALTRNRFNLPVYLVQASLVTLAGFLVVLGVRTAIKGAQDATEGVQPVYTEDTPTLLAAGLSEARQTAQDYIAAPDWRKKAAFVRRPDLAQTRMERFYQTHPGTDKSAPLKEVVEIAYNVIEGGSGFVFTCLLENESTIEVPVVRIDAEAPYYVVDWESLVDYNDVDWVEFLQARKPGSRGIYRLYGSKADFFAFDFSEPERYLSVQLYDMNRQKSAFGYVERKTADGREIQVILDLWARDDENDYGRTSSQASGLQDGREDEVPIWLPQPRRWAPMTIEVQFPEEGQINPFMPQLRILRFVSPNWVVVESKLFVDPD